MPRSDFATMSKTATFRSSNEYLRRQERETEIAWQIYNGKLALVQTYEEHGKNPPAELGGHSAG